MRRVVITAVTFIVSLALIVLGVGQELSEVEVEERLLTLMISARHIDRHGRGKARRAGSL